MVGGVINADSVSKLAYRNFYYYTPSYGNKGLGFGGLREYISINSELGYGYYNVSNFNCGISNSNTRVSTYTSNILASFCIEIK